MKMEVIQFISLRVKYLILLKFMFFKKTAYGVRVSIPMDRNIYRKVFEGYFNKIKYSVEI